jgi:hypothetical protein
MSISTALPPSLRDKLASVARHLRLRRAVRGLSLLFLALALLGGGALLADYFLHLPVWVRVGLLGCWALSGLGVLLFDLLLPLCRPLSPEALAAVIEEKYPDLGERLTSTVELAENADTPHGSPALIALLMQDTKLRADGLDFFQAVPAGGLGVLCVVSAFVLGIASAPALVWPRQYAELGQRFLMPWKTPPAAAPYAIELAPGDVFAARGRPITLTAHLAPQNPNVALPRTGTLVLTDAQGNVTRRPMLVERQDLFSLKLERLPGTLRYSVEAGDVVSDTCQITAVEPVELEAQSPVVMITPPEYAKETISVATVQGVADLSALQYSQLHFEFRFTQPAAAATLIWNAAQAEAGDLQRPLALAADRRSATLDLPVEAAGSYRLVFLAEHDIRTELGPRTLSVQLDQPPVFTKVTLPSELKTVLPYDRLPINMALADDVGVDAAVIEYRINDGPVQSEPLALKGRGTQEAMAQHFFQLGSKVKEGDEVRYRLKAQDNRSLPERNLEPNVIYHPEKDRWLTLKIAQQAESLQQQEILAQRDAINRKLDAIAEDLKKEQRGVYKVRQESRDQPSLKPEQVKETKELRQQNRQIEDALAEVARDAAASPALQSLGQEAQTVADQEMHRSAESLSTSEKEEKPQPRDAEFKKADKELAAALRRVEEMRRANDKLAQERLDQAKLELAAEREKQLAERAADLAAKDPIKDPTAPKESEQIKREQQELAKDLDKLAEQSEKLRDALDAARAEEAKQLAERARELAQQQRELAKAEQESNPVKGQLAALAHRQQELAEKAQRLAQETRQPTQAAKTNPLKPEEAQKAAESLKQGDAGEAVRHQTESAHELDRLAKELDRAIDLAKDPREAARQLARLEEGLEKRLNEETQKKDASTPLADRLAALQREQNAVQRAAERLSVPPQNQPAQQERQAAAERAAKAADALQKQDPRIAAAEMAQTRHSLERLAEKLPNLDQRLQQARDEVGQLRKKQDEINQLTEKALKEIEKDDPTAAKTRARLAEQLTEAARRQAESAERLSKMDAPNQEARQERVQQALNRALRDLMDARPQDVPASQQEARRELERLEQALNGKMPADDKAREPIARSNDPSAKPADESPRKMAQELAKQQKELAKATDQAQRQSLSKPAVESKPVLEKALEQIGKQQQQLNEQASQLPANQTQKGLEQAREAMNQAQQALTKNDAAQAQQKQREAASALEKLAQQLPDKTPPVRQAKAPEPESPAQGMPTKQQSDQARQLAKEQRELREEARKLAAANAAQLRENPVGELAKQQQQIAQQAAELAKNVGQEQGAKAPPTQQAQQASQSAQQAAKQLQSGALDKAQKSGQETAQQLRQLAQQMSQTPRPEGADPHAADPVQQARDLAQRQEDVNRRLQPQAGNPEAQRAQQQAQQQNLQQETGKLAQELAKLAQEMSRSPQAQQSASQASQSAQQASNSINQAQGQQQQGNQAQMQQAQQQAAQNLEQAAQQAAQAAQNALPSNPNAAGQQQAGQAVQQARGQMQQAQTRLSQGQSQGAQGAMQQAAQSLQQAAQQLGQQQGQARPNNDPGLRGASGDGKVDASLLPSDQQKYAGKRWGELPGELRTKILQDMQGKYGDDYARIIKLYFEQVSAGYHREGQKPPPAAGPPEK